jgi:hypothetical protein
LRGDMNQQVIPSNSGARFFSARRVKAVRIGVLKAP